MLSETAVKRYLKLLANRQFKAAEEELKHIKQKMPKSEWSRGYFRALFGMLLVRRSKNGGLYAFFSKIDLNDKKGLESFRREFMEHTQDRLHGDFDRGFFSAWAKCMQVLSEIEKEV